MHKAQDLLHQKIKFSYLAHNTDPYLQSNRETRIDQIKVKVIDAKPEWIMNWEEIVILTAVLANLVAQLFIVL